MRLQLDGATPDRFGPCVLVALLEAEGVHAEDVAVAVSAANIQVRTRVRSVPSAGMVPDKGFAARAGQMASIIWGIRAGRKKGDYLAVVNHETGAFQGIRKAVNDNAGPPFYNMLLILLVFIGGGFGMMDVFGGHYASALFFFAVGGGGIWWIWRRQTQFMAKIKAAALAMTVPTGSASKA